jgi:hypothetical protein
MRHERKDFEDIVAVLGVANTSGIPEARCDRYLRAVLT